MSKKSTKLDKVEKWIRAKELYVEGRQTSDGLKYPTYEEIAAELNLKPQTIRKKSSDEHWPEQRKQYEAKVKTLIKEDKSVVMAGESVSFDSECLTDARRILKQISSRLDLAEKTKFQLVVNDLQTLVKTLEVAQKVGRLAFGETTENTEPPVIRVIYEDKKSA